MPEESSRLALDMLDRDAVLDIIVTNCSSEPTRVWDRSNSWGWETLILELRGSPAARDCYPLTVKPVSAWTRNGPGFTEIPPGGIHHIAIWAGNPEWNGIERVEHLRGDSLWIRTYLRIPPSREADTFGVFVGEVGSPERESQPPHRWLF